VCVYDRVVGELLGEFVIEQELVDLRLQLTVLLLHVQQLAFEVFFEFLNFVNVIKACFQTKNQTKNQK
jgi:hypothetical protein